MDFQSHKLLNIAFYQISRMLAAKASLAIRYDALGEGESNTELAFANRGKIENRLKQLEKQQVLN